MAIKRLHTLEHSVRLGCNKNEFRLSEGIIHTLEPRASYFITK